MFSRQLQSLAADLLQDTPAVVLLGPRQIGKTTLALDIAQTRPSVYLDLQSAADRNKLESPELYLASQSEKLVVLDEIHYAPGLFPVLRGLIDQGRRKGRTGPRSSSGRSAHTATGNGRFMLLGSASMTLLQQSGESLAGRVAYLELGGLSPLEMNPDSPPTSDTLWLRGGFPDSLLARDDARSLRWRQDFIRTYLERDVPQLGPRIAAETLRRFWTMLAHLQASPLNAAALARSLAVDGKTVATWLDLLVDLLLVRRLAPWHNNAGKRLVKTPKVYVRDSGLVHALLGIADREALLGHPVVGASWEGFVVETLINAVAAQGQAVEASYYRSSAGAEIDLVLTWPDGTAWAIEVKRSLSPKLERGFHHGCDDVQPARRFVVYPGAERYALTPQVEVLGLLEMAQEVGLRRA